MMDFHLSAQQSTGIGLLLVAAIIMVLTGWWYLDRREVRRQDAYMRDQWAGALAAVPRQDYDGSTWDWPAGQLDEYFFGPDRDGSWSPVSSTSAMPVLVDGSSRAEQEADAFIWSIRRRTDAYITEISRPLPILR